MALARPWGGVVLPVPPPPPPLVVLPVGVVAPNALLPVEQGRNTNGCSVMPGSLLGLLSCRNLAAEERGKEGGAEGVLAYGFVWLLPPLPLALLPVDRVTAPEVIAMAAAASVLSVRLWRPAARRSSEKGEGERESR